MDIEIKEVKDFAIHFWFEQSLYDAIENGEYLDSNTISKYWCAARYKACGNSVEWFDEMKLFIKRVMVWPI